MLTLDCLEERLEVACSKATCSLTLDDLDEERWPVLQWTGENLQEVAFVVTIDEDATLTQGAYVLVDPADTLPQRIIIGIRRTQELNTVCTQLTDGRDDVRGRKRQVLYTRTSIVIEVLLDLRLAPSLGGLVDRKHDPTGAVRDYHGHQLR